MRSFQLTTVSVGSGKRKTILIPTRAMTSISRSTSTAAAMTSRTSHWRLWLHRATVGLVRFSFIFTRPWAIALLAWFLAVLAQLFMLLVLLLSARARRRRWRSRRVMLLAFVFFNRQEIWHRQLRRQSDRRRSVIMNDFGGVQHPDMRHENSRGSFFRIVEACLLLVTLSTTWS